MIGAHPLVETVDVLSGGRAEPCFGRGTAYPDVAGFFGHDTDDPTARFEENVRLIIDLWSADERLSWTGEFHAPLTDVSVHPRPVQRPRPSIWIGGGLAPSSVDLAVELGAGLMLPTVFGAWEMFVPAVERHLERWEATDHPAEWRRVGCCSHAFVGADSTEVRRRWARATRTTSTR